MMVSTRTLLQPCPRPERERMLLLPLLLPEPFDLDLDLDVGLAGCLARWRSSSDEKGSKT